MYEKIPERGKLKVGPTRDLLAKLNEARNGEEWVSTFILAERLGWAFTVTRGRLKALEQREMVEHDLRGGVSVWQGNEAGASLL